MDVKHDARPCLCVRFTPCRIPAPQPRAVSRKPHAVSSPNHTVPTTEATCRDPMLE